MEIIIILVLLLLAAFFSAAETALTSLPRLKVERLLAKKTAGAKIIAKLKDNPNGFLSTILICNNLVTIAAASITTTLSIRLAEIGRLESVSLAVGLATGLTTFFVLVFGEITPKTLAISNAEAISLLAAPVIYVLQWVLTPVAYLIGLFSRPLIWLCGGKSLSKGPFITEEEIHLLLAAGEKEGVIEEEEREMISSIFEFGDTVVREVMTPRPDIVAVDINQPLDEIMKAIIESGHSRIPVYDGNLDNVNGVVYAKDLLKGVAGGIRDHLRQAIFVPESKKISELLHEMQAARTHLAVIVDEYGMTSGLVTMEDLIEEIVGEIHDEFEREEKSIEKVDDNTILVNGKVSLADLNDQLKLNLPEDEYDSIGGLVFGKLGKVPAVGNVLRLNDILVSVERIHRRRITRVKITKLTEKEED
jgi:CBS domain containing-hemolysin-like protein